MTAKNGENTYFYIHDHLGSTSMVLDTDGNISQSVTYIPYGEIFVEERNGAWNSPYLFNSKELDEETGLYYYGARYLNPTSGMWLSTDPLFEKYVGMSPYNYCAGNPVKLVDPDGRALNLSGSKSNFTFDLLKAYVRNESKDVDLKLSEEGVVSYSLKEGAAMPESLNRLKEVIDSKDKVNIISEDSKFTSSGNLYVGGAFMGNEKQNDGSYVANQEVNPYVLYKMDEYDNNSVGKNLLHEITEAHEGIKLSRERNISSPDSKSVNSVYNEAHKLATPQTEIHEYKNQEPDGTINWAIWGVDIKGKLMNIQSFSKDDL